MGLSDEERLSGLFYGVNAMTELGDQLKNDKDGSLYYPKIIKLVDDLWHAFLRNTHNSSHWVFGSSATNEVTWGTSTAWGIGINHHTREALKEEEKERKETFNAFEYILNIPGLLQQVSYAHKWVYDLYAWSEQVVYYLRRYDDELLKNYEPLSKVISDIQGECFNIFKDDEAYARAYVLNCVAKIIYGESYPYNEKKWDVVTRYMQRCSIHHEISLMMQPRDADLKKLAELHIKLQKAKKAGILTKMMRLEAVFVLAGRRMHEDRDFKILENLFKSEHACTRAEIRKLKKMFVSCIKAHQDHETESKKGYEDEGYSPLSIYGLSCTDRK